MSNWKKWLKRSAIGAIVLGITGVVASRTERGRQALGRTGQQAMSAGTTVASKTASVGSTAKTKVTRSVNSRRHNDGPNDDTQTGDHEHGGHSHDVV